MRSVVGVPDLVSGVCSGGVRPPCTQCGSEGVVEAVLVIDRGLLEVVSHPWVGGFCCAARASLYFGYQEVVVRREPVRSLDLHELTPDNHCARTKVWSSLWNRIGSAVGWRLGGGSGWGRSR